MLRGWGTRTAAVLLLTGSALWSAGCSDALPSQKDRIAREIYDRSELPVEVRLPVGYVEGALAESRRRTTFDPGQFEVAQRVVRERFAAAAVEKDVLRRLAARCESEHQEAVLAWLQSPLATRFMAARLAASDPAAGPAEMKVFVETERASSAAAQRLALVERFNAAARVADISAENILQSAFGVAVMLDALRPAGERLGPDAIRQSMTLRRELLIPIFQATAAIRSRFIFRSFSDSDLEAVVQFAESDAGVWYYETMSTVLRETLEGIAAELGDAYAAALAADPGP